MFRDKTQKVIKEGGESENLDLHFCRDTDYRDQRGYDVRVET